VIASTPGVQMLIEPDQNTLADVPQVCLRPVALPVALVPVDAKLRASVKPPPPTSYVLRVAVGTSCIGVAFLNRL